LFVFVSPKSRPPERLFFSSGRDGALRRPRPSAKRGRNERGKAHICKTNITGESLRRDPARTSQRDVPTKVGSSRCDDPAQRAERITSNIACNPTCIYFLQMDSPRRKSLPHEIPLWVDPQKEIYFITIKCEMRVTNQLATDKVATDLFETIQHRQEQKLWWPHIFLLMPDHIHALISFPPSDKPIKLIVRKWKEWTAKATGIHWQRDFFEHRLRHDESRREKADYILQNPVRKKLVTRPEYWPFTYFADGEHPQFR
jgi:putative transposase